MTDPAAWMTLEAGPNTVNGLVLAGSPPLTSTLSAYSSFDVGPTLYYIQIWDLTTNTRVASCGWGQTCSVSVTQGSTPNTHRYVGTVAQAATAYPPTGIQATSKATFVTWQSHLAPYYSFTSVTGLSYSFPPYDSAFTVKTNVDVSSTPYYIEIFDVTKGTLVAACGTGTQCTGTVSHADSFDDHVAFISQYGSALLPPGIQAVSSSF
ncbi:hypothetical protein [Streptomyces sp. NPDC020983]|uniref:hypothetical protein n=1 Tax=Streptomyces sp. NPDC020983 TaxID=3365106 RepID=UPI0037ADE3EA